MSFSERYGYKPVREVIQIDSMNEELKNSLWSVLKLHVWNKVLPSRYGSVFDENEEIRTFCERLWFSYFKKPLDTLSDDWRDVHKRIRSYFFECSWNEVYDFIEFVAQNFPYPEQESFVTSCNFVLKRECSAYRFIDDKITGISDEQEMKEIESALASGQQAVHIHLRTALELLSDRKKPDYRNSIKESISAVESLVGKYSGKKGTLGDLMKKLEGEVNLHPALSKAFSSLYGYTSDEDGIRHAILESKEIASEDAMFFLVACSAFVNLLAIKMNRASRKPSS